MFADILQDPHGELKNKNVLIVKGSVKETAEKFGLKESKCESILSDARQQLWIVRQRRPRPHLDNKMVTAWNGEVVCGWLLKFLLFCLNPLDAGRRLTLWTPGDG